MARSVLTLSGRGFWSFGKYSLESDEELKYDGRAACWFEPFYLCIQHICWLKPCYECWLKPCYMLVQTMLCISGPLCSDGEALAEHGGGREWGLLWFTTLDLLIWCATSNHRVFHLSQNCGHIYACHLFFQSRNSMHSSPYNGDQYIVYR